jgi:hypothetical protein
MINMIKKKFQGAAHPDYNSPTGNGNDSTVASRILFNYPQMVLPIILIGNDAEFYYHFKPCLIKKVSVSFKGEGGMTLMRGGAPGSVELQIELMETSIWTASDYGRQGKMVGATQINSATSARQID